MTRFIRALSLALLFTLSGALLAPQAAPRVAQAVVNVSVWPALGTTVTLQDGVTTITADGAVVTYTSEIRGLVSQGKLLTHDPRPGSTGVVGYPSLQIDIGAPITTASLFTRSGTYQGQPIVTNNYDTGNPLGGGTFYWDGSSTATHNGGTIIGLSTVGRWLRNYSRLDVTYFGATGNGSTDDTTAIQRAITASKGKVLYFPNGTYKITSHLYFDNVGIEGESARGSSASDGGVEIAYYGTDNMAMTLISRMGNGGMTWKSFRVKAYVSGKGGVAVMGEHPYVKDVRIVGFDTFGFRAGLGTEGTVVPWVALPASGRGYGTYYGTFDGVHVENTTITGANATLGILVDGQIGGGTAQSNANTFRNCVVKGRWNEHVRIYGTSNSWWGGNTEIHTTVAQPQYVYNLYGLNARVRDVYFELPNGQTLTTGKLVRFDANAWSCDVRGLHVQTDANSIPNASAAIENLGTNCNLEWEPLGYNYPSSPADNGRQNLIHNSQFRIWDTTKPKYWHINSGTWSRVSPPSSASLPVTRGIKYAVQSTASGSRFNLLCAVYSTSPAGHESPNQVSIDQLRGQTVTASVWVYSDTAGVGNIQIYTGSTQVGSPVISAANTWQRLTVVARIDDTANLVGLQLRSDNDGANKTGTVTFADPSMYIGSESGRNEPRAVNDGIAQMFGPLVIAPPQTFTDGDTTPSVDDGNIFNATNTGATTITAFDDGRPGQIIYVQPTNGNTTLKNNSFIGTTTGADKALSSGVVYKLMLINGAKWIEF